MKLAHGPSREWGRRPPRPEAQWRGLAFQASFGVQAAEPGRSNLELCGHRMAGRLSFKCWGSFHGRTSAAACLHFWNTGAGAGTSTGAIMQGTRIRRHAVVPSFIATHVTVSVSVSRKQYLSRFEKKTLRAAACSHTVACLRQVAHEALVLPQRRDSARQVRAHGPSPLVPQM